ncbi:hypothetical protein [Sinomonas sp. P47F7]|uniref:hypothetical protein n=1 Tax=Sinomonas sp. P47F7 TaxID=3410987 RepID=UPI003BF498BC
MKWRERGVLMAGRQSKADTPAKPQPHRFRVSVPVADEAVVAWMELQDNPSLSVRMLIRESIERQGYVDIVNRPVSQLPRHGRQAETSEEVRAAEGALAELKPQPFIPASEPEVWAEVPTPAPRPQATPAAPAPAPSEPEQSSSELHDVNDIFSRMR